MRNFHVGLFFGFVLGLSTPVFGQSDPSTASSANANTPAEPTAVSNLQKIDLLTAPPVMFSKYRHHKSPVLGLDGGGGDEVEMDYGSPFSRFHDDPKVVENGFMELNTTVNALRTDSKSVMLPLFDLNLGYTMPVLHLHCHFKMEIPPVTLVKEPTDSSYHRIVGDSAVGSKCEVYANEKTGTTFAVYPTYEWSDNGVTQHFKIPFLAEKEFKHFAITGNVAYHAGIGNAKSFFDGGAGVGTRVSKRNAVFLGAYITGEDKTKWIEIGFRRRFHDNNFNFSYSHTVGSTPYLTPGTNHQISGQAFSVSWQINKQLFHKKKKDPAGGQQ